MGRATTAAGTRAAAALLAGLLLTLGAGTVSAAPTPAGTRLTNTATGVYVDSTGVTVRLASNTVATVVQPLEAVLLTGSQAVTSLPGSNVTLAHTLTNTGNVASVITLTAAAGGSVAPVALGIVEDLNGNGVADPGEPVVAAGTGVPLAPGASLNLLLTAGVPPTATAGQTSQLRLTARSQAQGAAAAANDTITILSGPVVTVAETASTTTPAPNGPVVFTVAAQNGGGSAANPIAINVNSVPTSLFILRDAVPANTTFATATSGAGNVQVLYHRAGDPANSYVTAAPAANAIDGVAFGVATLPASGSVAGMLGVTVNGNASGSLGSTAYADFNNPGAAATTVASNPLTLPLPPLAPTLTFYTSSTYATPTKQYGVGAPLYLQINAAQCNTDSTAVLTHPVTLTSALTGDSENFTATETAPNTGLFRIAPNVPTADAATRAVVSGDGILELSNDDRVTATLSGCGVSSLSVAVLIDPSGIVFNSRTNAPVAGASVELIDVTGAGNGGHPGGAATVLAGDGVTAAPSTVTTPVNGMYRFPFVAPSTYRLRVVPPNGLAFPSKLAPPQLPAGRHIDAAGSFGGSFVVSGADGPITTDIPLDSGAAGGLFVQKVANKSVAAVGDFVDYSVTISNSTGLALPLTSIVDDLPAGFAYLAGSARLDGVPLSNPGGGAGPSLVFGMGTLAVGTQTVLTYRVRIGPAGQSGTGTNSAQASSGPTRSNVASATVKVTGGVFSDQAYLIGKVYADCNADRVQGAGEPGIPGVRIYLDNGTYAVTDVEGKYSLYGLTPRTHVAKLDVTTLPAGTTLTQLDNRNAFDPGSRFVDLQNGELQKADFAIAECNAAVRSEVQTRREALKGARSEIAVLAVSQINPNSTAIADARSLPASGVVGQQDATRGTDPLALAAAPAASTTAFTGSHPLDPPVPTGAPRPAPTLAERLATLDPQPGFVNLVDGQVLAAAQSRVQVKGPFGAQLKLRVNGKPIGTAQVGEQSSLESRGVAVWDYIGVDLAAGDNLLELQIEDRFGNVHEHCRIHVVAPGELAKLLITAPAQSSADVATPLDVTVNLRDAHDVPVSSRTALTLEASLGEWQTPDLDPKEPGIQVFVEGGTGHFKLLPPATPGKGTLRVSSGALRAESSITFMPNLRPLLAAGIAEGVISLHNLNPSSLVPAQSGDAFEREIQNAAQSFDGGRGDAAARASLFLKGKILGSDLLTVAYDSDKPNDTPLFRDIQPDQYYPVYGDSSTKGFDAQSTGKLYVRLDRGTSYGLYGDYGTQSDNPARVLTQYSRALNGAKTHIEDGGLTVDGFASYTSSTQVIDELPANGTSGPYQLSQRNPVLNGQRVDIITRDRNQPSLVLADTPLSEFTDYAVEPLIGQILFKAPIPSLDSNLNPIYVRVVYEVSNGAPNYWVGGVDLREKLTTDFTAGGTFIRDTNPVTRESMGGGNFLWAPSRQTSVVGEVAQTQSDLVGTGTAHRVEFKHTDARVQARIYAVQTDSTFNNPSSTYTAGAAEYGAKISAAFDAKNRLLIDAIKTSTSGASIQSPLSIPLVGVPETVAGGGSRQGESVALEHTFRARLKLTAGVRHVDANGQATETLAVGAVPNEYTSARVRVDAPVPYLPKANLFTQYEQALDDTDRRDTTVGGTYQLEPQTKIYATHQTSNSLSGDYALNPSQQNDLTVVGIDTTYLPNAKMFDEYRVGDGIDGRTAQAAVGLRNLWDVAPGWGLSTSIQQIRPISGVVTNSATALTAALAYTANPDWKGSARAEWSKSETAETWLANIGAAFKVSSDLTALARAVYNEQLGIGVGAGSIYLRQTQLGFAYRPVQSDVWNALAWVENKRTDNGTLPAGLEVNEAANIFSSHLNYQVSADWIVNGRYGIKQAMDYAGGPNTAYIAQIVGARSIWDLNSHWDAGLQYFIECGSNTASRQQAIGGEVGYLVIKNLWLSIGYNILGFTDADLASEDYTQRAFYLRLRFKFDENLFKPAHNGDALPADTVMQ